MPGQRLPEHRTQLGQALRLARKEGGVLQKEIARALGSSQSSIVRMETGAKVPSQEELDLLLLHYEPTPELRERIMNLACLDEQDNPPLNVKFDKMLSASEDTTAIHTFHSERIPMTLQCDRYALKQYSVGDPSVLPRTVLRLRARRTRIFELPDPPAYHAIMTVSSLVRMPGGQMDLVQDQAKHLLDMLDTMPWFTLRVLHMEAAIAYIHTDFTLLKMARRKDDLVYAPFGKDGQTITDRASVRECERYWHEAHRAALSKEDTREFLSLLTKHGVEAVTWPIPGHQSRQMIELPSPEQIAGI